MKNILTKINIFFYNFFIPTVTTDYIIKHKNLYMGISDDSRWLYYSDNGYIIKVDINEQIEYLKKHRKEVN